jgi:hypothetical protein
VVIMQPMEWDRRVKHYIHRGDKWTLVSMDTKAVGNPAYIKEKSGQEVTDLEMEITRWLWFVPKRKTIQIQHDVTSASLQSYQLSGQKVLQINIPLKDMLWIQRKLVQILHSTMKIWTPTVLFLLM